MRGRRRKKGPGDEASIWFYMRPKAYIRNGVNIGPVHHTSSVGKDTVAYGNKWNIRAFED